MNIYQAIKRVIKPQTKPIKSNAKIYLDSVESYFKKASTHITNDGYFLEYGLSRMSGYFVTVINKGSGAKRGNYAYYITGGAFDYGYSGMLYTIGQLREILTNYGVPEVEINKMIPKRKE